MISFSFTSKTGKFKSQRIHRRIYWFTFIIKILPHSEYSLFFPCCHRFEVEALKTLMVFQLLHITEAISTVGTLECHLFIAVYELVSF